jgi:carbonic anhydrase
VTTGGSPADDFARSHEEFVRAYAADEGRFLADLVSDGQHPLAFFLGCSDSRVIPELLTQAVPGELFVVRNVANLLPPVGRRIVSAGAALEFAVGHLGVRHLIVCGHELCGGVRAAIDGSVDPRREPSLAEWLHGLDPIVARTAGIAEADGRRWTRATEENVLEQLRNATTYPIVAARLATGDLALHGWVFDLASGRLRVFDRSADAFVPSRSLVAGA